MRVICLVSSRPGHLDFGGHGFVELARELVRQGHRVDWIAPERQQQRLARHGFRVDTSLPVDRLPLFPLLQPEQIAAKADAYAAKVAALKAIARTLRQCRPALLLIDRVLALGPLLAANLGVPAVVVGTNGEYCRRDGKQVRPVSAPVAGYVETGERLKRDLGWRSGVLGSYWGQSDIANISFLGRSFYQGGSLGPGVAWYLNRFGEPSPAKARTYHGVSFGNSGDPQRMTAALDTLLRLAPADRFELYCGTRDSVYARYAAITAGPAVFRWVPFGERFDRLRTLAFFGGIGTLWLGIAYQVPMLFVPGGVGDQLANAERAQRLGLGETVGPGDPTESAVQECWRRLQGGDHQAAIAAFKASDNFTHTLETAVSRLARLLG